MVSTQRADSLCLTARNLLLHTAGVIEQQCVTGPAGWLQRTHQSHDVWKAADWFKCVFMKNPVIGRVSGCPVTEVYTLYILLYHLAVNCCVLHKVEMTVTVSVVVFKLYLCLRNLCQMFHSPDFSFAFGVSDFDKWLSTVSHICYENPGQKKYVMCNWVSRSLWNVAVVLKTESGPADSRLCVL